MTPQHHPVQRPDIIALTESERAIARQLAEARQAEARAKGIVNRRQGPDSDLEIDIRGMEAELAFAKLANVYPDLTICARSGGEDAHLGRLRIDVKATPARTGRLLATLKKKRGTVDAYVLMIGRNGVYAFAGWCMEAELISPDRVTDLGHGPAYVLPPDYLRRSLDDLLDLAFSLDESAPGADRWAAY